MKTLNSGRISLILAIFGVILAAIWLFASISVGIHGETAKWLPPASVLAIGLAIVLP